MEKYSEDLLQHLIKDDEVRQNWYKARHYVNYVLSKSEGRGLTTEPSDRIHIAIEAFPANRQKNALMFAVIRQICLMAHYPNFNEETGEHKTLISIYSGEGNVHSVYDEMKDYPYLGNLLEYCKCTIEGKAVTNSGDTIPLDIEFQFVNDRQSIDKDAIFISHSDVENGTKDFREEMDITMGMLVNMVYHTGAEIDNLPANDNANIERYSIALNVFCYKLKPSLILQTWKDCARPQEDGTYKEIDIKNQLSSVFCADCFDTHIRWFLDTREKTATEYLLQDFERVMKKICEEKTITSLARCEHARWNVEKLIMGFKPLSMEDWYEIETCFGDERKRKIKALKKIGRHIDICSCKDLHRVNPSDIKYDFFLMLAMPQIMRSYLTAK